MGLTGRNCLTAGESSWLTSIYLFHGAFCDCGEPVQHLIKCLHSHITEDDGFGDEELTFAMDAPFDDDGDGGDTGGAPGSAAATDGYVNAGPGGGDGDIVVAGIYEGVGYCVEVGDTELDYSNGLRRSG
ncbi:ORF2 [torque teno Delphinidae virus 52]